MSDTDEQNPKISLLRVMEAFSTEENPVSSGEFRDFWASLSKEEQAEFKAEVANL